MSKNNEITKESIKNQNLLSNTIIKKFEILGYNQEIKLFPYIQMDVFNHTNRCYDLDFDVFILNIKKKNSM